MTAGKVVSTLERRQKILELRKSGKTLQEIGTELGISKVAVHTHIKKAIQKYNEKLNEETEWVIFLENSRLDEGLKSIWAKVQSGDLKAIDTMVKIMDRRAKLLGLDQPTKTQTLQSVEEMSDDELVQECRRHGIPVPEEGEVKGGESIGSGSPSGEYPVQNIPTGPGGVHQGLVDLQPGDPPGCTPGVPNSVHITVTDVLPGPVNSTSQEPQVLPGTQV